MRGRSEHGARKANALDAHVASRLRMRRLAVGLSQEDLGRACGVAMQQIQKYEAGQNRIPATRLFEFAGLLAVTVDWFFEDLQGDVPPAKQASDRSGARKLDGDVVKLLNFYRKIKDADDRNAVRQMARSFAKRRGP